MLCSFSELLDRFFLNRSLSDMGLSLQTNSTLILENGKNGHVCSQNSYIVMLERIIAQIVLLEKQASLFKQIFQLLI